MSRSPKNGAPPRGQPAAVKAGMNRAEAFAEACKRWGDLGMLVVIGVNRQYVDVPCHVGVKTRYGRYKFRGVGLTWEEAFANVIEWPDGPEPRSEQR